MTWTLAVATTAILVLVLSVNSQQSDSQCIYTDTSGEYCNCDGSDKNCLVASVNWRECGDVTSELQILVNRCMPNKAKDQQKDAKKHAAFKHTCGTKGDVSRQWYGSEDCTGAVTKIEALSTVFQPCAQVTCNKNNAMVQTDAEEDGSNVKGILLSFVICVVTLIAVTVI